MRILGILVIGLIIIGSFGALAQDQEKEKQLSQAEEKLIASQQDYIKCIARFNHDFKSSLYPFSDYKVIPRKIPDTQYKNITMPTRYITYSRPNVIIDVTEHGAHEFSPETGETKTTLETIQKLFAEAILKLKDEYFLSYDKDKTKHIKKIVKVLSSSDCNNLPEVAALKNSDGCQSCAKITSGK